MGVWGRTLPIVVFFGFISVSGCNAAPLELDQIIQDNMVFERNEPIRISGRTSPFLKLSANFNGQYSETMSDSTGAFAITLSPMQAAPGATLSIQGLGEEGFQ
jgi:hypothetical protein